MDKDAVDAAAMADDGVTITASPKKGEKGPEEESPTMFTVPKTDQS